MVDPQPERVEISTRTLVEAMIRADGTVDAGELYAVAGSLRMTDQQVRLCVKRLVAEGRFTHEGRGRKAVLRATAETTRAIAPDVEFVRYAFRQDGGLTAWDGTWWLVAFAIPERARQARDALRDTVVRLGGAPLQGGLYVSANAWEELIEAEADRLGVRGCVTFLTSRDLRVGGEGDPRRLAARLWPLDDVAGGYARLADIARPRLDRLRTLRGPAGRERLIIAIELAAEFTRAIEPDPLLPPELLPQPWPGTLARALVAEAWGLLLAAEDGGTPRLFHHYADVVREAAGPAGGRPV